MATGLLLLLDDIASILDDVATLTKVWAVAKGSMLNKAILIPGAVAFSAYAPWAITPLMIVGGSYAFLAKKSSKRA